MQVLLAAWHMKQWSTGTDKISLSAVEVEATCLITP